MADISKAKIGDQLYVSRQNNDSIVYTLYEVVRLTKLHVIAKNYYINDPFDLEEIVDPHWEHYPYKSYFRKNDGKMIGTMNHRTNVVSARIASIKDITKCNEYEAKLKIVYKIEDIKFMELPLESLRVIQQEYIKYFMKNDPDRVL